MSMYDYNSLPPSTTVCVLLNEWIIGERTASDPALMGIKAASAPQPHPQIDNNADAPVVSQIALTLSLFFVVAPHYSGDVHDRSKGNAQD
jgi:hypothetical protein